MAEIRWVLTCEGDCPTVKDEPWEYVKVECPQHCPNSHYEKEQLNTEVPSHE